MIVAEIAVAVQLVELCELRNVIRGSRAVGMPRHVDFLPRRHRTEDLTLDLRIFFLERTNLGRHIHRLERVDFPQFRNAFF